MLLDHSRKWGWGETGKMGGYALGKRRLSYFDEEARLMQLITVLGGLVGIAAGLAQVAGKTLRNPWENEEQR